MAKVIPKLIVALGNHGVEYELTRHNFGWLVVDGLPFESQLHWKEKFKGVYCSHTSGSEKIYFLKPHTYMNLSGQSVQALMSFFKITAEELLVIHDDLDLEFGKIVFKNGGGLGGHNGLKSIVASLGTRDFMRLRLGIGRPSRGNPSNWVLSRFTDDEFISLERILKEAAKALETSINDGFSKAATLYSRKNFSGVE